MSQQWEEITGNDLRYDAKYKGLVEMHHDEDDNQVIFTNLRARQEGVTNVAPIVSFYYFL